MTRDPRAFGLPARHDEEFARLDASLAGIRETRGSLQETAKPAIAEESLAYERYQLTAPAGTGRREPEGGGSATDSEVGRARSSAQGAAAPGFR